MGELKLHDIKGLVEVPDNSLLFFSATVLLSLLAIGLLSWAVYRFLQRKKHINWHALSLERLQNIDFSQSKQAAYEVTAWGDKLTKSPEQKDAFDTLVNVLEAYKYKKEVHPFDAATQALIENFIESFKK